MTLIPHLLLFINSTSHILFLYSQLDDRRVEAEKTLMSQKNTFETMKKKNEVLKQHNQKLKVSNK